MSRYCQNWIFYIWISLMRTVFFDIFEYHGNHLFEWYHILSFLEIVGTVLKVISFKWFLMIKRFYQFVKIKITHFWFLQSLCQSIVLKMSNTFDESYLYVTLFTPLWLLRPDRVFSTMTRFLPGDIKDAFQNYVPKSMPITWLLTQITNKIAVIRDMIFMILIILWISHV